MGFFIDNSNQVYFLENQALSERFTINRCDHHLKRLFLLKRDEQGKIEANDSQARRVLYRVIKEVTKQCKRHHQFSSEFIFAQEFSQHYNEFAQYFPELGRLRELSKATAIIKLMEGCRLSNQEAINEEKDQLQNQDHWQKVITESKPEVRQKVNEQITSLKAQFNYDHIRKNVQDELDSLLSGFGTLHFTVNSPEMMSIANKNYDEARDKITRSHDILPGTKHQAKFGMKSNHKCLVSQENGASKSLIKA
jgi:hypothetical protein